MEYYSAFKELQIQSFALTWITLEDIMLIEISQSHEILYDPIYGKYLK